MQMPGRNASTEDYRYGYQGSEKDREVSGEGNSYSTFYRQLDPRLGRWKSIDPKSSEQPGLSPFCSMNNNPILMNDPMGDIIKYDGSEAPKGTYRRGWKIIGNIIWKARARSIVAIAKLVSPKAREMIQSLQDSPNVHTIDRRLRKHQDDIVIGNKSIGIDDSPRGLVTTLKDGSVVTGTGVGTGSRISIGRKRIALPSKSGKMKKKGMFFNLLHELFHSYQMDRGEMNRTKMDDGVSRSEWVATHNTNIIRAHFRILFRRGSYKPGSSSTFEKTYNYRKEKINGKKMRRLIHRDFKRKNRNNGNP
jgi:RHS repeat-associated protein